MSKRTFEAADFEDGELEDIEEVVLSKDDEDGEELMQFSILPVKKLEKDVPMTGEEYLYLVREERNRLPKIVTAENVKRESMSLKDLIKVDVEPGQSLKLIPNEEWQEQVIEAYRKDRITWAEHLNSFVEDEDEDDEQMLSSTNDEKGWERFLYKRETGGIEPSLKLFYPLGHVAKMRLILFHSRWISNSMTELQYRWIYCLLANTLEGLSSDDTSILRALAKSCLSLRSKFDGEDGEVDWDAVSNINAIITIITLYYRQLDLLQ